MLLAVMAIAVVCCKKDDDAGGPTPEPPRDRAEQAARDEDSLQKYLKSHTYNYQDFEEPVSMDFNYEIKIRELKDGEKDSITPLIDFITTKKVTVGGVEQNLYVLQVRKGERGEVTEADSTLIIFEKGSIDGNIFDSTVTPVLVDMPGIRNTDGSYTGQVFGFSQGIADFGGATNLRINSEGLIDYDNNYGIGAVFIPSGLGFFNGTRSGKAYDNLVYTFKLIDFNSTDHDGDNIASILEDLNGDNNLYNDNTDGDFFPNYLDIDDDGDGTRTVDEDLEPDSDLSVDRDGDGDPTNDIGVFLIRKLLQRHSL